MQIFCKSIRTADNGYIIIIYIDVKNCFIVYIQTTPGVYLLVDVVNNYNICIVVT